MKVRRYQPPFGRIDDFDVRMDPDDAPQVAALAARHIVPAIDALRDGGFSVTLEADDLEEDWACHIAPNTSAALATLRAMVRTFRPDRYDARLALLEGDAG